MSRGNNPQGQPTAGAPAPSSKRRRGGFLAKFIRIEIVTVLFGVTLLLIAVALFAGLTGPASENKQINSKEYQAVFLNNGQVYFGKINELNSKFLVITSVFYIENNSQSTGTTSAQNTNYTLRKLGTTELHAPEDKMVVNRDQVTFWENLKDSGQVVTKINEYYKNPNASSSNSSSTTTPSSTTTTPATTQPATTTTPTTTTR